MGSDDTIWPSLEGLCDRQVSWLFLSWLPSYPELSGQWPFCQDIKPFRGRNYSCGAAPDSHGIPYSFHKNYGTPIVYC